MALWKILPVAPKKDPRWLGRPVWKDVVVRAPTSADARLVAADMERREMPDSPPLGNESPISRSGFEDEKLYNVRLLGPDQARAFPETGPDEVVQALKEKILE
ncbi:MAG: hypothetical protein WD407_11580 [Rhodospirillales bacterium]